MNIYCRTKNLKCILDICSKNKCMMTIRYSHRDVRNSLSYSLMFRSLLFMILRIRSLLYLALFICLRRNITIKHTKIIWDPGGDYYPYTCTQDVVEEWSEMI